MIYYFSTVFLFSRSLVQVVLKADAVKVAWEDRELDEKEVNNDIANWFMHTEAPKYSESINLNISSTPPLRLIHYTLGDVHYLGIAIHHAVYDAVTLPKILRDVELSYSEGAPNPSASLSQVLDLVHATSHLNFPSTSVLASATMHTIPYPIQPSLRVSNFITSPFISVGRFWHAV